MHDFISIFKTDMIDIVIGMFIIICSYFSNLVLSVFYNVKIVKQLFEVEKLKEGLLKLVAICVGIILLIISIDTMIVFANNYILIDNGTSDFISSSTILIMIGTISIKYMKEAFSTLQDILVEHVKEK